MNLEKSVGHSKIPFALSLSKGSGIWNAHQMGGGGEAAHASTDSARTASSSALDQRLNLGQILTPFEIIDYNFSARHNQIGILQNFDRMNGIAFHGNHIGRRTRL